MIEINEKQLRNAIRNPATKDFPFCNIAKKIHYIDNFGIVNYKHVAVYGKKIKNVVICSEHGRQKNYEIIVKVKANVEGYLQAIEAIEKYFNHH